MATNGGHRIVLTANRLLMADYACLFDAMIAASQTTATPRPVLEALLMPAPKPRAVPARTAPLGLRRIEAVLAQAGFDVCVCHPDLINQAIGPQTAVIGVATGEPLGRGMNSSTMAAIAGGRIWPEVFFEQVLEACCELAPNAQLVIGGPGAWQIAQALEECPAETPSNTLTLLRRQRERGRLTVVEGYCEGNVASLFARVLETNQGLGTVPGVPPDEVPAIQGAAAMGAIEMSCGCGWGCQFCTIAQLPMRHLPASTIESDVERNLAGGQNSLSLLSEDFFRYGARGARVDPGALIQMLARLRENRSVRLMQIDHANVSSIAQFSDQELAEVRRLQTLGQSNRFVWVNVGIETASGELLARNGGRAKMAGCAPEDWHAFTQEQVHRLILAGFYPLASLVLGMPSETAADAERTLQWVREASRWRMSVFPVALAPLDCRDSLPRLTKTHWQTIIEAYRMNFKWVPRLVWDNEQGAGAPLARRLAVQFIGKAQVVWWNAAFRNRRWRAPA